MDPDLERFLKATRPGRALDLACGRGRNAIWLAEHGWQVTAIDRDPAAIASLPPSIDAHVADLEAGYRIEPASWDLIVICRYLQRDLYAPAIAGLVPGGIIVASALLETETPGRFRVKPGEFVTYFKGCEILHARDAGGLSEVIARKSAPSF
jgi:SAM-dependent methyltransferase